MTASAWAVKPPLAIARSHPAVAVFNNRIYVFGGGGVDFKSLNSTVVYDPQLQQWRELAAMPSLRSGSVAVNVGEAIYVMGGGFKQSNGQFRFLRSVEIYYPNQDRWQQAADMLQPHDYPAVALLNNHIYVMGGHHPSACTSGPKTDPGFDFCERLNLDSGQWQQIAPLPTPRFALTAVVDNQQILTFGGVAFTANGFNNFDVVEVYDQKSNQWQAQTKYQLPWTAAGLGSCRHNKMSYIFGGYSGEGIHNRAACYSNSRWTEIEPMPMPCAAMGVASIEQGIYLIGGWADDGRTPITDVRCYQPNFSKQ